MKVNFEKVPNVKNSFLLKEEIYKYFDINWHVHPEYEIALLEKAKGSLLIGDAIRDFENDELILLGPNLPHSWLSDKKKGKVKQIIIQFMPNFVGDNWLKKTEVHHIATMLKNASLGIRFSGKIINEAKQIMHSMLTKPDFEKFMDLLFLLSKLARSNTYEYISNIAYSGNYEKENFSKLNMVYDYILQHFKDDITIVMMSELTHMTPNSFSRYFKKSTKKTFSIFLNEVRISHACRLLQDKKLSISQICFEAGYGNLSNFNRQFKKNKGITPTDYLQQY